MKNSKDYCANNHTDKYKKSDHDASGNTPSLMDHKPFSGPLLERRKWRRGRRRQSPTWQFRSTQEATLSALYLSHFLLPLLLPPSTSRPQKPCNLPSIYTSPFSPFYCDPPPSDPRGHTIRPLCTPASSCSVDTIHFLTQKATPSALYQSQFLLLLLLSLLPDSRSCAKFPLSIPAPSSATATTLHHLT